MKGEEVLAALKAGELREKTNKHYNISVYWPGY